MFERITPKPKRSPEGIYTYSFLLYFYVSSVSRVGKIDKIIA